MDELDNAPEKEPVDNTPAQGERALETARGPARGAAATLRSGIAAVRDVRNASRRHSSARSLLREMSEALSADEATLARREEVAAGYEQIVEEQSAIVAESSSEVARQRELVERAQSQREELEAQLDQLRKDHEQELRPYKRIVEAARGPSEEALNQQIQLMEEFVALHSPNQ